VRIIPRILTLLLSGMVASAAAAGAQTTVYDGGSPDVGSPGDMYNDLRAAERFVLPGAACFAAVG
jgi:hypothetical protein